MFDTSKYAGLLAAVCLLCLASTGAALAHSGDSASGMTQTAGGYKIALKVLPAEKFVSQDKAGKSANAGEMVNGSGADPVPKGSDKNPNHHLVVFIKKNGQPVTDADVTMSYKKANASGAKMTDVPVVQMWVAGKGKKTTHYGNNVNLQPGKYKVHVVVNDNASADFKAHVKK